MSLALGVEQPRLTSPTDWPLWDCVQRRPRVIRPRRLKPHTGHSGTACNAGHESSGLDEQHSGTACCIAQASPRLSSKAQAAWLSLLISSLEPTIWQEPTRRFTAEPSRLCRCFEADSRSPTLRWPATLCRMMTAADPPHHLAVVCL